MTRPIVQLLDYFGIKTGYWYGRLVTSDTWNNDSSKRLLGLNIIQVSRHLTENALQCISEWRKSDHIHNTFFRYVTLKKNVMKVKSGDWKNQLKITVFKRQASHQWKPSCITRGLEATSKENEALTILLSSKHIFCQTFKAQKLGQLWNFLSDTRSQRGNPGNCKQHLLLF